jgi:hypothetical protein
MISRPPQPGATTPLARKLRKRLGTRQVAGRRHFSQDFIMPAVHESESIGIKDLERRYARLPAAVREEAHELWPYVVEVSYILRVVQD